VRGGRREKALEGKRVETEPPRNPIPRPDEETKASSRDPERTRSIFQKAITSRTSACQRCFLEKGGEKGEGGNNGEGEIGAKKFQTEQVRAVCWSGSIVGREEGARGRHLLAFLKRK